MILSAHKLSRYKTLRAGLRGKCKTVQCSRYTSEKVALAIQDLVDLQGPDLPDSRVGGVQEKGLDAAIWHSGGQCKLTRVAVCTVLHAQTVHLHTNSVYKNHPVLPMQLFCLSE